MNSLIKSLSFSLYAYCLGVVLFFLGSEVWTQLNFSDGFWNQQFYCAKQLGDFFAEDCSLFEFMVEKFYFALSNLVYISGRILTMKSLAFSLAFILTFLDVFLVLKLIEKKNKSKYLEYYLYLLAPVYYILFLVIVQYVINLMK